MKKIIAGIFATVIALTIIGCGKYEKIEWPSEGLAKMLPTPDAKYGEIYTADDDEFWVKIEYDSDKAESYISACKEKGFDIGSEVNSTSLWVSYYARNKDRFSLDITYYASDKELSIRLNAPEKIVELSWPTQGLASLLPEPKSKKGFGKQDFSDSFYINVADTSKEKYSAYIDECMAKGFNVDYSRDDEYFSASNANGDELSITFDKYFDIMEISLHASEKKEKKEQTTTEAMQIETETPQQTETEYVAPVDNSSTGLSTSLKEFLDSYEATMNGYCDFMEAYNNSSDYASMMGDYMNWLSQYSDMLNKFNALDTSSFSDEDWAYYLEVQNRVNNRLISVI